MSSGPPPYSEKGYYQTPPTMAQPAFHQAPPTMGQPVYGAFPTVVGDVPVQCVCLQCRTTIVTRTAKKNGLLTWLICGGAVLFGFWCCCCIPFCVDACKDTEHYCPQCSTLIGVHKQL